MIETSEGAAVLRVEGRITGYYVEELRRACDARASLDKIRLSLELADVSFADPAVSQLLKDFTQARCRSRANHPIYDRTAQRWGILRRHEDC